MENSTTCYLPHQEYDFSITLRQQWNDKRLVFKNKLTPEQAGGYGGKYQITKKYIIILYQSRVLKQCDSLYSSDLLVSKKAFSLDV